MVYVDMLLMIPFPLPVTVMIVPPSFMTGVAYPTVCTLGGVYAIDTTGVDGKYV